MSAAIVILASLTAIKAEGNSPLLIMGSIALGFLYRINFG